MKPQPQLMNRLSLTPDELLERTGDSAAQRPGGRPAAVAPVASSDAVIKHARNRLAVTAVILGTLQAVGAVGGGLALMLGPRGEIVPLPISLLTGSPFDSYFWPGLILFFVLGLAPLAVAVLAWRGHRWAPMLTVGVGVALLIWLAVEIAIVGYSNNPPLQPIYLGLGAALVVVGIAWWRQHAGGL